MLSGGGIGGVKTITLGTGRLSLSIITSHHGLESRPPHRHLVTPPPPLSPPPPPPPPRTVSNKRKIEELMEPMMRILDGCTDVRQMIHPDEMEEMDVDLIDDNMLEDEDQGFSPIVP